MTSQLRHACFERSAGARGGEEEQHRQHLVAQECVGFVQGTFALQIPGYIQHSFDFLFREVQVADKIPASKIGLHSYLVSLSSDINWWSSRAKPISRPYLYNFIFTCY